MDGAVIIREFTWDDYAGVGALWQEAFGGFRAEDERDELACTIARNPGLFLVAERAGAVVGTVVATWDGRRGHLYHVAVAASVRRQGVGRQMILAVEDRLRALGVRRIHLRVHGDNAGAIAFYRTLGFEVDLPVVGMHLNWGSGVGDQGSGTNASATDPGPRTTDPSPAGKRES